MGLDTTHGCWHGAYSAFMRWRQEIAHVAGFPPLMLMEGFYDPKEWWLMTSRPDTNDPKMYTFATMPKNEHGGTRGISYALDEVMRRLPIKWDIFGNDPLAKLLAHSDCGGELEAEVCGPLADRLEGLLPLLPEGNGGGHIGVWR
jgi:hypothetical protein